MVKPAKLLRISQEAQNTLADLAHILTREQGDLAEEAIGLLRERYTQDPKVKAALDALEAARRR